MSTITQRAYARILKRTQYGEREETAETDGIVLFWNNGSKRWHTENLVKKGTKIKLDANEILLPLYKGETVMDVWNVIGNFAVLPLYKYSFESRYLKKGGK
jgi:hypothetical protein